MENIKHFFTKNLLKWFASHHRPMPWKGEKNPYLIWLSEIILQQTRVEQGLPYFLKFKENYPTVTDLANAPEDEVMRLWQGLGYYSRARNLHFTAKYIAYDLNGEFPNTYTEILKLKGVGAYTAAAISSFAYDLPNAVVDGNVYRVLARYFGIETPIDTTEGKKKFTKLAYELLDKKRPADYNQAIMDLGATQCTPKNPNCKNCPLNKNWAINATWSYYLHHRFVSRSWERPGGDFNPQACVQASTPAAKRDFEPDPEALYFLINDWILKFRATGSNNYGFIIMADESLQIYGDAHSSDGPQFRWRRSIF